MARPVEPLVPKVQWLNCWNSGFDERHQIGLAAHCTTRIVAPTTTVPLEPVAELVE